MATRWRDAPPDDSTWRATKGVSATERASEQDRAAGGRDNRRVTLPSGRVVLASIYLRLPPRSRRVYAYLRWPEGRKTREKYVCQVNGDTREDNLAQAWRRVLSSSAATPSWASTPAARTVMRANRSR